MNEILLDDILRKPAGRWLEESGPESDVLLSSRIRLARNVRDMPFPHLLNQTQGKEVLAIAESVAREINKFGHFGQVGIFYLDRIPLMDRMVLVEKHLISPQHARKANMTAVILREDEAISIMVNEEDHFRIQCLASGLQLERAWELADRIDDLLEEKVSYAFDEKQGYLTTCPTNVGTGLRASVMMHLPALVISNQVGQIVESMNKIGVAVRGFYGEGTEAIGNIFQISNQTTLGRRESEIIENLLAVCRQLIGQERLARDDLLRNMKTQLEDRVGRAYGILSHARIMSSDEAMRHLSDVRLGLNLGLLDQRVTQTALNRLMVAIRPAYLQKVAGRELTPQERDTRRASLVREVMGGSSI